MKSQDDIRSGPKPCRNLQSLYLPYRLKVGFLA